MMIIAYNCNAFFRFARSFCAVPAINCSELELSHFSTSGARSAVTISPCRRSNAGLGSPAGWRRTVERAMVAVAASLAWI
ncbi:MAG: hypothetical protein U1B77_04480, partial [Dehalococcoidales bacterium]|nr:hypothetical protein [Dehalococcoidales bacterium]